MDRFLESITLCNFRNYKHLYLNFDAKVPTIFIGKNGAGKTNILESISIFEARKGLRHADADQMQSMFSSLPWAVNMSFSDGLKLSNGFGSNGRRVFKVNGKAARFSSFAQFLWITWITPKLVLILSDNTTEQRKFFDHIVSGILPDHKAYLRKYNTLLKERIKLLEIDGDAKWLDQVEKQIGLSAIAIHKNRVNFLKLLSCQIENIQISIEGEFEKRPELNVLTDILKESRDLDRKILTTLIGPHKTCWKVLYKEKNISALSCSTGEQKVMLFEILFASIGIYKQVNGGCCMLLLDEIFAHLDRAKSSYILSCIDKLNIQCFFTSADPTIKELLKNGDCINVNNAICYRD